MRRVIRSRIGRFGVLLGMSLVFSGMVMTTGAPVALATDTGCGVLIGSGLTLGLGSNPWSSTAASDGVAYAYSSGVSATNDFALFQTHDPWGYTVLKSAITGGGHTYSVFTPNQLSGFTFSDYRVVVLNWDDTFLADFDSYYEAAIPSLESYINNGGVVWVQGATQGSGHYSMPFGGTGTSYSFEDSDPIVDTSHPLVAGISSPITGSAASHVVFSGLPSAAHIIVTNQGGTAPVLYVVASALCVQPDGQVKRPGGRLRGNNIYNDDGSGQSTYGGGLGYRAGTTHQLNLYVQNDGLTPTAYTYQATGDDLPGFVVTYRKVSGKDLTSAVEAGTFTTPVLAPGERYAILAFVTITPDAARHSSVNRLVTVTATTAPFTVDAIGFGAKRR
jgi:hypothetical protein